MPLDEAFFVAVGFTTTVCVDDADRLALLMVTVRYPAVDEYKSTVVAVPPSTAIVARPAAGPVAMTTEICVVPVGALYVADAVDAEAYLVVPPE